MVMKRFEIIEKLYLSKALLKMAGGGDASPIVAIQLFRNQLLTILVVEFVYNGTSREFLKTAVIGELTS